MENPPENPETTETTIQDTYTSDQVSFNLIRKENCQVEFDLKATPALVKDAYQKALKEVTKHVSIPGFRKGKAPSSLIEKNHKTALEERWKKIIADLSFQEAQKLAKVSILHENTRIVFNLKNHSIEEGAELTFSFEAEPQVPHIELEAIDIKPREPEKITEEKLKAAIEYTQSFFTKWNELPDQEVKPGHYVTVDVDIIEGETPEQVLTDAKFEVSDEKMAKWMKDLVIGMKVGDSKEGLSTPDESATEEEKKQNPAKKVKLTLKKVEEAILPPLDDEFAQKVGAKNTDEMKDNLTKLLEKQAIQKRDQDYKDELCNALLEKYTFDLPKTLVDQEIRSRLQSMQNDTSFQESFIKMDEDERKRFIESVQTQSEKAVRLFYLCFKVIKEQNIPIDPTDVSQEDLSVLDMMMPSLSKSPSMPTKEQLNEQNAVIVTRLILNKAQDFMLSKILNNDKNP